MDVIKMQRSRLLDDTFSEVHVTSLLQLDRLQGYGKLIRQCSFRVRNSRIAAGKYSCPRFGTVLNLAARTLFNPTCGRSFNFYEAMPHRVPKRWGWSFYGCTKLYEEDWDKEPLRANLTLYNLTTPLMFLSATLQITK